MKNNFLIRKIVLTSILTALSIISFVIENIFPPLVFPGAKMGISNVFIILTSILCGISYGFISLMIKVLLGSLLVGNISAIVYSLPSGIISILIESLLIYYVKNISLIATSILGSVINITVQNVIFCLITNVSEYLIYLPYLAVIGTFSGCLVGFLIYLLVKKLPVKFNI